MEQADLAKAAKLSAGTVKRLEKTVGPIQANASTEELIRQAFAAVGVDFIDPNGGGAGVRARRPEAETN